MCGIKALKTEPRRLHPLLLRDSDGAVIDWRLQARWQVSEALPPFTCDRDGGEVLNQYLRRRQVWTVWRDGA